MVPILLEMERRMGRLEGCFQINLLQYIGIIIKEPFIRLWQNRNRDVWLSNARILRR